MELRRIFEVCVSTLTLKDFLVNVWTDSVCIEGMPKKNIHVERR